MSQAITSIGNISVGDRLKVLKGIYTGRGALVVALAEAEKSIGTRIDKAPDEKTPPMWLTWFRPSEVTKET